MSSTRFRSRIQRSALLAFVVAAVVHAEAATFRYQAFVAGARAGKASVTVTVVEDRYEVTGTAKAEGVVDVFSNWRTRFQAHGQLLGAKPQLIEYSYVERDDDQRRQVTVRDGMLRYFKNGRKRREQASPSGLDVLTALFVHPSCASDRSVHSGRKHFRLTVLDPVHSQAEFERVALCRYVVVDDDDDRYRADIQFGRREDLTVPISITVRGFLTGKVVLVDQ